METATKSITSFFISSSDTKYRVIADGNFSVKTVYSVDLLVRYQVPRYSGWKRQSAGQLAPDLGPVRYQVPRYSGWKQELLDLEVLSANLSDTKYRVIADGNRSDSDLYPSTIYSSDTKYRVIADGNWRNGLNKSNWCFGQKPSTAI